MIKEIKRIWRAGGYSWLGLRAAVANEPAVRTELILFVVLAPCVFWLGRNAIEYALLFGALFLVLLAELLNSAIEVIVDRISSEWHELSGRAKDIGSAAVFIALINFLVVWGLLLFDRITN
ncbi:MAG: diacylglycerol kinase [Thiohalophilus sp.]|uniref:diacylglycerol kinase n=1 Tax=Thiohalophilus sp. TaxID=3028392 RepID=UPI0028701023|nr:diacylglycerol kinase [Thiohalophilus sp.]MDR9435878.1 diacylglycerol kinase [Thiohalophilus sp.]